MAEQERPAQASTAQDSPAQNSTAQDRITARYQQRDASAVLSGFWTLRNPVVLHLAQERERAVLAALQAHGVDLSDARVLDVGCGGGGEFANVLRWGAPLHGIVGVDLMLQRARIAHRQYGGHVANASGAALPFADASFDLVVQSVVFSSITDAAMRQQVARQMQRVLRPGGWLLWYDAERTRVSKRTADTHFRNVPRAELQALFAPLQWLHLQRLSTDLGVLKRVHALLGANGMLAVEMSGLFKTHVLALGQKP